MAVLFTVSNSRVMVKNCTKTTMGKRKWLQNSCFHQIYIMLLFQAIHGLFRYIHFYNEPLSNVCMSNQYAKAQVYYRSFIIFLYLWQNFISDKFIQFLHLIPCGVYWESPRLCLVSVSTPFYIDYIGLSDLWCKLIKHEDKPFC